MTLFLLRMIDHRVRYLEPEASFDWLSDRRLGVLTGVPS